MSNFDKTKAVKSWRGIQMNMGVDDQGREHNNYKFWEGYLLDNGEVWSVYGRVGDTGKPALLGTGEALLNKKIAEKKRGKPSKGEAGYVESKTLDIGTSNTKIVEVKQNDLAKVASEQIITKSPEAKQLIKKLCELNVHQIMENTTLKYNSQTGLFSTPLGIVTQEGIDDARNLLSTIGDLIQAGKYNDVSFSHYSNQFFQIIPQDLGRRRLTPQDLWPNIDKIVERNTILDNLEASLKVALTPTDDNGNQVSVPKMFEASIDLVEDPKEFKRLSDKFHSTLNSTHRASRLKLKRAFHLKIDSMHKAFTEQGLKLGNVKELWHGTGPGNIISICKSGFKIKPPSTAAYAGSLFGSGCYFAIQSTKSLNYSHGYWTGETNPICFLFLNDVAMGKYEIPYYLQKTMSPGYDSFWAQPGKSGIKNDEIIVFKEFQINPRYLLEFSE